MLHHIDVHVRDLGAARSLFDGLAELLGYRMRVDDPDFIGYEYCDGGFPRIGFERSAAGGSGTLRLAFAVATHEDVDRLARIAAERGAQTIEGPSQHPEYGDEYYAVFFEDADGNKYEIVAHPLVKPRVARVWRGRVRPGTLDRYRKYIEATGIKDYRATPGNRGAYMLTAPHADHGEVVTLSFWESRDAIEAFAGNPIERARYYPEDAEYLLDFPERVEHYDV